MNTTNTTILFFAAASLALGGIIAHELRRTLDDPLPAPPAKEATATAVATKATSAFRLQGVQAYDAIAKRPLFSASRRPPEPPPAEQKDAAPNTLRNISLSGVVIAPGQKTALVHSPKSPTLLILKEGQTIEGWRLDKVLRDRIQLSSGDKTAEIVIWDRPKSKPRRRPGKRRKTRPVRAPAPPKASPVQPPQPLQKR